MPDWFTSRPEVPDSITISVFKVPGETNTDDLSPATDAWSRPDIPLHANAMLKFEREGISDQPLQGHCRAEGEGSSGGLRRRCGRYRLVAQVGDEFGALAHG